MPVTHTESIYGPEVWVHLFSHKGRNYRLYKRDQTKAAPWHFRIHLRNQPHRRSLDTSHIKDAEKRAKIMIDQSQGTRWNHFLEVTNHRRSNTMTLGELLDTYTTAAKQLEIKDTTAYKNKLALRQILRGKEPEYPRDDTPLYKLITGNTVNNYKAWILESIEAYDDETQTRRKRSANSTLTQARAVFAKHLLDYYHRTAPGWETTPEINKFLTTPKFRKTKKLSYHPPADDVIQKTFADLPALATTDPNVYTALWLAIGFGLRKSEIIACRKDWFIQRDGTTYLCSKYIDKGGEGMDIPCQNGAWQALQPILLQRGETDHLIQGSKGEREQLTWRRLGPWMTDRGWHTQKKVHEFRAWAGCQVIQEHGILTGSQWLRHNEIKTTQEFYGRYLNMKLTISPRVDA